MPGNTKFKRTVKTNTTREYHNQKDGSGVLQTKVLPGSVKNKRTAREYNRHILGTVREYNNKKDCKGVSQAKVLPGSATNNISSSECHNQKEFQEVS